MDLKLLTDEHEAAGWEIFNVVIGAAPDCKILRVRLFNRDDIETRDPSIIVYRGFRKPYRRMHDVPCYIARRRFDDAVLTKTESDKASDLRKCIDRAIYELHVIKPGWGQRKGWKAEHQIHGDAPTKDQVDFRRMQIRAFRGKKEES